MSVRYADAKNSWIFQEFLFLLGGLVHSNLIKQMDYLKVAEEICYTVTK